MYSSVRLQTILTVSRNYTCNVVVFLIFFFVIFYSKISIRVSSVEIGTKFSPYCLSSVGCTGTRILGDATRDYFTLDPVALYFAIVSLPGNVYGCSYLLRVITQNLFFLSTVKKTRSEQKLNLIIKIKRIVLIIPSRTTRTRAFHHP